LVFPYFSLYRTAKSFEFLYSLTMRRKAISEFPIKEYIIYLPP
jgi:hypothetical protein